MNENMLFLKKAKDKNLWNMVRTNPKYCFFVDELLENYKIYCEKPIEELPYSLFKEFFENGSRAGFENVYFPRRHRLNTLALLSMIYPENDDYITKLQDTIWAICNEYSWALPAHIGLDLVDGANVYDDERNPYTVDLFAAETGFALSEIKHILSGRFDDAVNKRISSEIDRRIITSYLNNNFFWETVNHNWAAVCAGSVGCTFMYERPDMLAKVKDRISNTMDCFLSGFGDEGVCEEGTGYWDYGFGFFVAYAQLLYETTGGKENLFDCEHVKKIAEYSNLIFLNDGISLPFGDNFAEKTAVRYSVVEFLRGVYGDCIPVFSKDNYANTTHTGRWQCHIRSIIYYDPQCDYNPKPKNEVLFKPGAGQFIKRGTAFDLAVTANNNGVNHNHNDLGSFIVRYKDKRIFDDFGCGEYTKDYFTEKRYEYLVCSSRGHSVPVVNGIEQQEGAKYRAIMTYDKKLCVDLTNAYENINLKSFVRSFEWDESSITLKDIFEVDGEIKERFVTGIAPVIDNGVLKIADAVIEYDNENWECVLSQETFLSHYKEKRIAYMIDFVQKSKCDQFTMKIFMK